MTSVKRAGKRTGIYPDAWNVKFQDDPIKSVDFDSPKSKTYQDYQ